MTPTNFDRSWHSDWSIYLVATSQHKIGLAVAATLALLVVLLVALLEALLVVLQVVLLVVLQVALLALAARALQPPLLLPATRVRAVAPRNAGKYTILHRKSI